MPRLDVLDGGTEDALPVQGSVGPVAPVLDRDRRLRQPLADAVPRDRLAVLLGRDRAEQGPVGRIDERVLADRDRMQGRERAAVLEIGDGREAHPDEGGRNQNGREQDGGDDPAAAPAALRALAQLAPAALRGKLAVPRVLARGHARTPAARRRSWERTRRSLSRRSAAFSSSAQALTVIVARSARALTKTAPSRSLEASSRSRSTAARRSLWMGICTVISASLSRLRIVEFRMVSEASFSLGMTSR